MSDERISEIKARVEAATKGPWVIDPKGDRLTTFIWNELRSDYRGPGPALVVDDDYMSTHNADFIANAREDIPYLLAEISCLSDSVAEGLSKEKLDELIATTIRDRPDEWDSVLSDEELLVGMTRLRDAILALTQSPRETK
jgi:hypothetical protein